MRTLPHVRTKRQRTHVYEQRKAIAKNYDALFVALGRRDGFHCKGCDSSNTDLQIDHIKPVSLGGTSHIDNLQILCAACNNRKHATTIDFRRAATPPPTINDRPTIRLPRLPSAPYREFKFWKLEPVSWAMSIGVGTPLVTIALIVIVQYWFPWTYGYEYNVSVMAYCGTFALGAFLFVLLAWGFIWVARIIARNIPY